MPLVPSIVRMYVALARYLVVKIVRMEDTVPPCGGVTDEGLKIAVILVGTPIALSATGELKVPIDVIPIGIVPFFPRIIDLAEGAEI